MNQAVSAPTAPPTTGDTTWTPPAPLNEMAEEHPERSERRVCRDHPIVGAVAIRDSKGPIAGHITVSRQAWAAFVNHARSGHYDLP